MRHPGPDQYELRLEREDAGEMLGRKLLGTLGTPGLDERARSEDQVRANDALADAHFPGRIRAHEVHIAASIERELHALVRYAPVSELVIIASDLYFPGETVHGSGFQAELPSLTRLARWGTRRPLPSDWRAWLAASLPRNELASVAPATIAATALAQPIHAGATSVWLAEPLHLTLSLRGVHLPHHGRLRLDAMTRQRLSDDFVATFAPAGLRLMPLEAGDFVLTGTLPLEDVLTVDPARWLGASLAEALPRGAGSRAVRALASEIELWLHEHPLNLERARARQPTIGTLWLWGAGPPPAANATFASQMPATSLTLFGDDPYVAGLAKLNGLRARSLPRTLAEALPARARRTLCIIEAFADGAAAATPLEALEAFERDWIAPALAAVVRGELTQLTLIGNDRSLAFAARHRLRFWRAPRKALEAFA
jgi:hypothetical protein